MKTNTTTVCYLLTAIYLLLPQPCWASFFEMSLKQDSIYTPGKMHLTMKLTDKAKIEGDYRTIVSVYMAGTLIRKQTLMVTGKEPVVFELMFPDVYARTDSRCRSELFIDEQFIEAKEKPLTLWPTIAPYPEESINNKKIWTFDTSGKMQELFEYLEVEAADATFQSTRDFGTPAIFFIGQYLDPNSMRLITRRLKSVETKPVIVFLRQKQLLKNAKIEIPTENNSSQNVECDANCPLLNSLNLRDVMNMVDGATYVKIKKEKDKNRSIDSYVTEVMKDKKSIYSYLCTVKEKGQVTIYCQLPVTDDNDPRYAVLLNNLLRFADIISGSKRNQINRHIERK